MPYDVLADLPEDIRDNLPVEAQRIWMSAYNSAEENDEENPAAIAWAAVKNVYAQNEEGEWTKKSYKVMKSDEHLCYTLGVSYPVNEVDKQGDYAKPEVVREAAWNFMKKLQGKDDITKVSLSIFEEILKAVKDDVTVEVDVTEMDVEGISKSINDMHQEDVDAVVVESYIAPVDFELGGEKVKKGDWLVGCVWNREYFDKILSGERTGYSIEGIGVFED